MYRPTGIVSIHPPSGVCNKYQLEDIGPSRFLNAVINHPIVLPDGRLLAT